METVLIYVMVSSTNLFQGFTNFSNYGISVLSKCTIKTPANTEPKGDPMATSSLCW